MNRIFLLFTAFFLTFTDSYGHSWSNTYPNSNVVAVSNANEAWCTDYNDRADAWNVMSGGIVSASGPQTKVAGSVGKTATVAPAACTGVSSVGTYTFCVDSSNSQTTGSARAGDYALVNVVKGFTYTFSVGNVFTSNNEFLTLLDASNDAVIITSNDVNGASLANWVSTLSGQVKVILSASADCSNNGMTGGTMSLNLIAVNNTQDSQLAFGTNSWIGHVYNISAPTPPITNAYNQPLINPSGLFGYVGYVTKSETFAADNFGGNTVCYQTLTNGVNRTSIYSELFAIRYRMRSTKAGCYMVTVRADDGVRLYVDGVMVFNAYTDHVAQTFGNVMVYLSGNSDLVLDYYDSTVDNEVSFNMVAFDNATNTITPASTALCSGTQLLNGSSYLYNGGANPTIKYQWQSSTNNTTWTDIAGATAEDYTPPAATPPVTNYYRRVISAVASNATSCTWPSSSASISTVANATPSAPVSLSATNITCSSFTANWNSVANATSYYLDVSQDSGFGSGMIYSNFPVGLVTSFNVTGPEGATLHYRVRAYNSCNAGTSSNSSTQTVFTNNGGATATISGTTTVCQGAASPNVTFTNPRDTAVTVTYTINSGANQTINVAGNSSSMVSVSTAVTGSFTYRLVNAFYQSGPLCSTNLSGVAPVTVTISPGSTATFTNQPGATVCLDTDVTYTTQSGQTNYSWTVPGVLDTDYKITAGGIGTGSNSVTLQWLTGGSKTVTVSYTVLGGCLATAAAAATTVSPLPTATFTVQPGATVCSDTDVTYTTQSGQTNYSWTVPGVLNTDYKITAGGIGTGSNSVTLQWLTGGSKTVTVNYTAAGGCLATAASAVSTVITTVVPTISDVVIGCSDTSFTLGTLTVAPGVTDYRIDVSKDLSFAGASLVVNDFPLGNTSPGSTVVPGLTAGDTHYARVRSINSCGMTSANSVPVMVSVPLTTYQSGGWDNGDPTTSSRAIFDDDYTITAPLNACSCEINSGKNVVVGIPFLNPSYAPDKNANAILNIINGLEVSGTLTFENNSSLIQQNEEVGINSGIITYRRVTTPMKNFDYTYWSSPVTSPTQTLKALVPNTLPDKYFKWGTTAWVGLNSATVMDPPGTGYIIRRPKPGVYLAPYVESVPEIYEQPVQFVGSPNNGVYYLPINAVGQYNLIGNPYPSALSADLFLKENCMINERLVGTLYFWTHNTPVSPSGYESADYATYNFTGGVGTGFPAGSTGVSNEPPSGEIAAGQSFFVASAGTESVVFNNSMRAGDSGNNSQFFRVANSKTKAIEKNRVWLNLTNAGGAFKQMLVGYVEGATAGFDVAFDGVSLNGNSFVNFYSINENKNLTIQGRGLPFDTKDQVPLGYSTTIAGTFEISIDHTDGSLSKQPIYVEDKMTNVIHNLKNGPYSFSTDKGTFNERMVLRYSNKAIDDGSLGNQTIDEKQKGIVVSVKNHKIKIKSFDEIIDNVMIYDIKGSLLYKESELQVNEFTIPNFTSSDMFLVVKVQLNNGEWISKKIVF